MTKQIVTILKQSDKVSTPLLILSGAKDRGIDPEGARILFKNCKSEIKSIEELYV